MKAHRQYFERYAEQTAALASELQDPVAAAVVVPAYAEALLLPPLLGSCEQHLGDVLLVLVINRRVDSPITVAANNRQAHAHVAERYTFVHRQGCLTLYAAPWGPLAVLETVLPRRQGVGLARKQGLDLAWAAWHQGLVRSPWLRCTDADVVLPQDYQAQGLPRQGAAALFPYRHRLPADPFFREAILRYEIRLRHYTAGLRQAGSTYAFSTVGSTIAVHAEAYAKVRGMPKRAAGEDFHFLNKLAKVGPVHGLAGEPLILSSRISTRVPFGTGRAMTQATNAFAPCYHPDAFKHLHDFIRALDRVASGSAFHLPPGPYQRLLENHYRTRIATGAHSAVRGATTKADALRRMHTFFDALRTLKVVHLLQAQGLRPQSAETVYDTTRFGTLAGLEALCCRLRAEETVLPGPTACAHDPRAA